MTKIDALCGDERELGLDRPITRRDFVNSVMVGAGASLLTQSAPLIARGAGPDAADATADAVAFDGYSGVGDYARANGNTWQVVQSAHAMRDGAYNDASAVIDTGELYDVVVVGGGFSGMGAAHRVLQLGEGRKSCLILENHPMWGGEAKRNEFIVNGVRLMAPQGSNNTSIPEAGDESLQGQIWRDLKLPDAAAYSELSPSRRPLEAAVDNYTFTSWGDDFESHGFYFPESKRWVTNPWGHGLAGTPWSDEVKRDMLRWRHDPKRYYDGPDGEPLERWLDSMTYEQYLTKVMGLGTAPARYVDDLLAAAGGLGSDVTSAYGAMDQGMPGFQGFERDRDSARIHTLRAADYGRHRFPGGNDGIMRAFVKRLVPGAIAGGTDYADVHNGAVRFEALDRPAQQTRIRLGSLVSAVEHEGARDKAERVAVTYVKNGRLYKLHARGVVLASACWTAKHIVRDLPDDYREAMGRFYRSPMLIVNVALTNWRALYKLGYTAASWRGGFGFSFNICPAMHVGSYAPEFDPDKPVVLTYYVPFCKVGLPVAAQGVVGRNELLGTPYRDYERTVRAQLTEMLSAQGFSARNDIAGITLNRWGHAYVDPYPGFYFGRDGKPAPRDVVRRPLGRIAFGHSELLGHQYWNGGVEEGRRAAEQVFRS